ncbi:MAG: hypothetical protein AAF533_01100 [Acidobacteriota bacterium]
MPLIDSVLATLAVLLGISFLIKSLTSAVKRFWNHRGELLEESLSKSLALRSDDSADEVVRKLTDAGHDLRTLRPEDLTESFLEELLQGLDHELAGSALPRNRERLQAGIQRVQREVEDGFAQRNKRVALVWGLLVCFLFNINAFEIWERLSVQPELVASLLEDPRFQAALKDELDENTDVRALAKDIAGAGLGVGFWIGKEGDGPGFRELLACLLTGVLVSIGAPYLHDLTRMLSRLRSATGGDRRRRDVAEGG